MKAIDMTKVYKDYRGKWVALEGPKSNKVVASGTNLRTVITKAEKKGFPLPMMLQVPKEVLPMVGLYSIK